MVYKTMNHQIAKDTKKYEDPSAIQCLGVFEVQINYE